MKGADGVRTRGGERLEFEYSTNAKYNPWRLATEAVVQRNFSAIGIKLDIQNYPGDYVLWLPPARGKGVAPHREPFRAGMTSPSLITDLAMTLTMPFC